MASFVRASLLYAPLISTTKPATTPELGLRPQPRELACSHRHRRPTQLPPRTLVISAAAATADTASGFRQQQNDPQDWSSAGPAWGEHSNFPLRQQMLECSSARDLDALLQRHADEIGPADVAASWHVAVQQRLLTLVRSGDVGEKALVDRLLSLTEAHCHDMDPNSLSTVTWAVVASDTGTKDHVQTLLAEVESKIVSFRPAELCVCLWAASSATALSIDRREALFKSLTVLIERGMTMQFFSAYDLSVLVWSMGRVNLAPPSLLAAAEAQCCIKAQEFSPTDTARLMHGFSMLRHNPSTLMPSLAAAAAANIDNFSPDDITLFLVSLGKLCVEPDSIFMRAANRHIGKLAPALPKTKSGRISNSRLTAAAASDFSNPAGDDGRSSAEVLHPRHMAHIMWTLARLEYRPANEGSFFVKALRHLGTFSQYYTGEDIAAMLWACSRLNLDLPVGALERTVRRLTALVPDEEPSVCVSALRHMAVLVSRCKEPLMGTEHLAMSEFALAAAQSIAPKAASLSAADVASFVVALGTLEAQDLPSMVHAQLQAACIAAAQDIPAGLLPKITWAAVRLCWVESELMEALAVAATSNSGLLPPEGLAQLAWSFAALDQPYPAVTESLARHCGPKLDSFTARDKARLAWAFAQLERFNRPGQRQFLKRVVRSVTRDDLIRMDPLGISAVMWACTKLDDHPGGPLEAAAKYVAANSNRFSRHQLMQAAAAVKKHPCKSADTVKTILQAAQDAM